MFTKQLSVFLENQQGALSKLTKLLGDNGVDLIALSIGETQHYGIVRMIAPDIEKCQQVLKDAGYTVRLTDVLAVCIKDQPGGLAGVLNLLDENLISVEYLYSFVRTAAEDAVIIFLLSDIPKGHALLSGAGYRILMQDEVSHL